MRYLNESIEVHSRLNPLIWDENNRLREEVKEQLTLIVDEFITELEENDIPVRVLDTYIVGSNASYNYTENSDLDVHIVVNMSEITCDPTILNLLYNYFKSYFNDKYDISIHGIDVELYVEDVNSSSVSNGVYSLSDEEWIKFPEPVKMNKIDISDDIQPYVNMYHSAVNANDGLEAQMLVDDLYLLRKNSLSKDGEFGVGNLIFKEFRDNGWLDTLKELSNEYKSTQLSLEGLEEKLQEVVNYQDIDYMIEVARSNHPTPRDIFQTPWDYLVDPTEFFNEITKNASPDYRRKARNRILSNDKTNEFYKVVLGYLDSIGTGYKGYPKLEPALVKEYEDELIPQDGRHRALLCKWLGIKLPVRVSNQGANGKFESTTVPLNKESGHKRKHTKLSSTHGFEHKALNAMNEIVNKNYTIEDDWDKWQGGGYEYKDFEPETKEFMSNHLKYTTSSLSRIEMPAYSTKNNTLKVGDTINMGLPRSFSRTLQGTINIINSDDYTPEDSCILRTTGKVQYFDSRDIVDNPNDSFAFQEEVLCGGTFIINDITSLKLDEGEYIVYVVSQTATPVWSSRITEAQERTVYNALNAYPNYKSKYGSGSALFELKYRFHLSDEELVWIMNMCIKKGWMDDYDRSHNVSYLGLEEYEDDIIHESIEEAYLDDEEKFWDYKTEKVSGKDIFDTNIGESSFAKDMIELAKSGEEDEYGHTAKYVMMSPREYFEACEKGFGIPASTQIKTVGEHDKGIIQELETVLDKYKVRFPITYLNYSYNGFTQEGRHRMFIAGQRFGWDTKFPVLVINTTEEATKAHNEENITRYISKALRDTKAYTFDDFDDIKEQFMYDIERYMDNPKVEFNETDNEYIFIVNGVEYPEDKEEFNFHTPEQKEETNIDDIDIEDLLDLDDLSDDDIFNM